MITGCASDHLDDTTITIASSTWRHPRASAVAGTRRISTSHPTPCAYFLSVVTDGECLPALSKRDTALLVVPMRSATASWVRRARVRWGDTRDHPSRTSFILRRATRKSRTGADRAFLTKAYSTTTRRPWTKR